MNNENRKLTEQQLETIGMARENAQLILKACDEAHKGNLDYASFEKRISKIGPIKTRG